MNCNFVGGHFGGSAQVPASAAMVNMFGRYYVSRVEQPSAPGDLIVFCSARNTEETNALQTSIGYFEVTPPNTNSRKWSKKYSDKEPPSNFGFVDPRFGGKAVCAMFDGSAKALDTNELQDMRRWCDLAARADDADYTLKKK